MTKEGRPFWSLPKRPPRAVEFDPENETHAQMVASYACLLANMHSIKIPYEKPRSKESRHEIAVAASKIEGIPEFVPNDQKASQIESQVDKEQSKDKNATEEDPAQ
jgi:Ubiquitin-activating enzyme active site